MVRVVLAEFHEIEVEALLRPVSSELAAVTPVSRRIEVQGGEQIQEHLERTGRLPIGGAVITPAGELNVTFVIHVVIQSPSENVSEFAVQQALLNGLRRASEWGIETLGLFPLGTGAGNLDAETAASLMVPVILRHIQSVGLPAEVTIVASNEYERDAFSREVDRAMPVIFREET